MLQETQLFKRFATGQKTCDNETSGFAPNVHIRIIEDAQLDFACSFNRF